MGLPSIDGGEASRDASESVSQSLTFSNGKGHHDRAISSSNSRNAELLSSTSHNMAHSAANSPAPPSASHSPKPEEAPQSHPMTTSTSNSSHHSTKDSSGQDPAAAHYGTRSRNRPGILRPNYAEDVEMDFEHPVHVNGNRNASSSGSPPAPSGQSPAPSAGQKRVSSSSNGWPAVNSSASASIPGTSTFSANPNVNVPKKRKAPQGAPTTHSTSVQAAQAHSMSRRANTSAGAREARETNMFSFDRTQAKLQNGRLVADDGTIFSVNDHVYLVCEPPGDPYYLGRLMEFRTRETDNPDSSVDSLRINWVYRPRDVQRFSNDTRLVFATMHSDVCPLTSLRGRCIVSHKTEFDDLEEYRSKPDRFYYNQVFDRFMLRWFEVIPVAQVINVPENVKRALDERWKFIIVEASKVKEYTSDAKRCKRCSGYCANNDSVDCAVCHNTYHMNCVQPPLQKKPSRGFAWACAPCSRAQERKLEARRTPIVGNTPDAEEDVVEEEEEEDTTGTTAATPEATDDRPATEAEIAHAKMWTMRYLGIHCRVEDALQYDDRAIYPRASSRLGPKHQANVIPWYGRAVQLVKPAEIKKKFVRAPGKKEATRLSKETQALIEADRVAKANRSKWIQDEPVGYVHRGEDLPNKDADNTAKLCFKMPNVGESSDRGLDDSDTSETLVDAYMERARKVAKDIGVKPYSLDFLDRALYLFQENSSDADAAIKQLRKTDPIGKWPENKWQVRKDLRDPERTVTPEEKKRFEEGVAKFGSELRLVRLHVKTLTHADVVRYWYIWKKTAKGKEIWGSFGGRRNTKKLKAENEAAAKLLDDLADDRDDSAFDNDKIEDRSRRMTCKYCSTRNSRVWRRAPGVSPGETVPAEGRGASKKEGLVLALCDRCARLWRKYAIKWENMDEIMKKLTQVGSKAWKKKLDPELLKEIEIFNGNKGIHVDGTETPDPYLESMSGTEPAKKKARLSVQDAAQLEANKKRVNGPPAPPPRAPSPPLVPALPKLKHFPCAICETEENSHDQLLVCRDCRLTVHRKCYGQTEFRDNKKWSCDMCANDRKESASVAGSSKDPASYEYNCILCPVHLTQRELVEPPKTNSKKKSEKEKVKEQVEREFARQFAEEYRLQQKDRGRPQLPREALKRTADNNWVHVSCALFLPDIKFSNAKALEAAEGVPFARRNRIDKRCSVCNTNNGALMNCHAQGCQKAFHVMCAVQAGQRFGFDLSPVKSTRRDESVVTLGGEQGKLHAAMWCKEHSASLKTPAHALNEIVDQSGLTALQAFAQHSKQADLTLTGTTRKANQLDDYTKLAVQPEHRRSSTSAAFKGRNVKESSTDIEERRCVTCAVNTSPKWWQVDKKPSHKSSGSQDVQMVNGFKAEPPSSRESSMRVEAILSNGVPSPQVDRHMDSSATVASSSRVQQNASHATSVARYECHKCHIRRQRPQPADELAMEIEPTVESPVKSPANPPAPNAPLQHAWSLSNIPAQQPTHGTWPLSQFNGTTNNSATSPQYGQQYPPQDSGYPPSEPAYRPSPSAAPPPPPAHVSPFGSMPPGSSSIVPAPHGPSAFAQPGAAPSPSHAVVPNMTNGLPPHSPSRTHPIHPGSRQTESPYQTPQPHAAPSSSQGHNYSHHHPNSVPAHHGSPVPTHAHQPSGPSLPPLAHSRPAAHGASASPSLRNLLD